MGWFDKIVDFGTKAYNVASKGIGMAKGLGQKASGFIKNNKGLIDGIKKLAPSSASYIDGAVGLVNTGNGMVGKASSFMKKNITPLMGAGLNKNKPSNGGSIERTQRKPPPRQEEDYMDSIPLVKDNEDNDLSNRKLADGIEPL
jgi:hypothetical protein